MAAYSEVRSASHALELSLYAIFARKSLEFLFSALLSHKPGVACDRSLKLTTSVPSVLLLAKQSVLRADVALAPSRRLKFIVYPVMRYEMRAFVRVQVHLLHGDVNPAVEAANAWKILVQRLNDFASSKHFPARLECVVRGVCIEQVKKVARFVDCGVFACDRAQLCELPRVQRCFDCVLVAVEA